MLATCFGFLIKPSSG